MLTQVSLRPIYWRQINKILSSLKINHFSKVARQERRNNVNLVKTTLEATPVSSNYDWTQIRENILQNQENSGQYSLENIDASILNYCLDSNITDMGLSYINFMSSQKIEKNLATSGKYLQLLFNKNVNYLLEGRKSPPSEETNILECYENLRNKYPILDSYTLENCMLALSLTNHWKKCLDIWKEIEITSSPNIKASSALIAAAFLNGEHSLAWKLLDEVLSKEKLPLSIPFITYINIIKKSPDVINLLEKLLLFFHENDYICSNDMTPHFFSLVQAIGVQGSVINLTRSGHCKHCSEKLKHYELTTEDFKELKDMFMKNAVIGRDVFLKSNPEELNRFKEFIKGMDTFDVVIDGLNVAYSAGANAPKVLSEKVAAVVSHFAKQNKKILLLGREHMKSWPQITWNYITKNSAIFLTQNISQDDPYFLYCALNSGKNTIVVTKDLMRGHKFLLKLPKFKILFNRWLSQRQYQLKTINEFGKPIFRSPVPFNIVCQKNGNSWHIPYGKLGEKDEYLKTWFCIKLK